MKNKAFTLFEVLVSLVILSVVLISISKFYIKDDSIEVYYELQKMENEYIETNSITNIETIKFK